MDLYLVRHAIAADRGEGAFPNDDERPLTPEGIHKFRLAARGLSELGMKPGRIVSSPLLRAKQTAEILRDAVAKDVAITISPSLTPNAEYGALLKALAAHYVMRRPGTAERLAGQRRTLRQLASALVESAPDGLDSVARVAWAAAADDAGRLRAVVDQVAQLTDSAAVAWHAALRGQPGVEAHA